MNYWLIGFSVILLLIIIWFIRLEIKLSRLKKINAQIFSGTNAQNLEEALCFYTQEIKKMKGNLNELEQFCDQLNNLAKKSIHKVSLVRFNPFSDTGGNQSFVVALLNHHNDGVVISSLHGREGTRIYAKPVLAGKSKYNLSTEEIMAIEEATKHKK